MRPPRTLERIFHDAPEGVALLSLATGSVGEVLSVNPALARLVGAGNAPAAAVATAGVLVADRASRDALDELASGRRASARLEWRFACPPSPLLRTEVDLWRVDAGGGDGPCAVAQLRQPVELPGREWVTELQNAVAPVLARTVSGDGALAALLPALAEATGFEAGVAWVPDGEDLRCDCAWGLPSRQVDGYVRLSREVVLGPEGGLPARVRAGAAAMRSADVAAESGCPRAGVAARDGLRSAVAFPVLAGNDLLLVIELVGTAASRDEDDDLLTALSGVAGDIGEFLARKRVEQRPRSRSELLLVEDNAFVARLVREMLEACELSLELVHVESLAEARERLLSSRPACVLLDLSLSDADGIAALLDARRLAPDVPIVVLTGHEDEELAVRAVQEGAQDYLMKRHVDFGEMARSIRYAMERKRAEQQLLERALHDSLTGLPNRVLFLDRLRVALARSEQTGGQVAVILLNLDRFRMINDSLGHEIGDRVLAEVALRLERAVGREVTVASLAADEFAVLLDGLEHEREAVDVAERLAAAVGVPFALGDEPVLVTATMGVALAGGPGVEAEKLVGQADTAMSQAKARGGARYEIFEEAVRSRMRDRLKLESGLRTAIETGQLRAHYQSIRALDDTRIVGFEALVRWEHPQRGLVAPGEFMPIAEESGLVVGLGHWVLEEACRQLAAWQRRFLGRGLTMNVNLSPRQLVDPSLVDMVRTAVTSAGIDPGSLYLEVTETAVIEDFEASVARLVDLRALGVNLALDDFGTGYSSLSYLRRLPIDVLKLDRSFVTSLGEDQNTTTIVAAVANMADALGIPVLAEGIETVQQLDAVREIGYGYGQGYHFDRPLAAEHATRLLERQPVSDRARARSGSAVR